MFLARDLINTPANDMGPEDLAAAARHHGGEVDLRLADGDAELAGVADLLDQIG